jgi:regulator of cell morphogenesis and NO signaling
MLIHENMKLAEVIHHDHTLIPIINRFGIHLGFGDDNIAEVCLKHHINPDFFLSILNAFHDANYFPKEKLRHFHAVLLIDYLQKAHHDFLQDKLPEISGLIKNMAKEHPLDDKTTGLISDFFTGYTNELTKHILQEEETVYPYILQLEKAISENRMDEKLRGQISKNPILAYEAEHENVEEKLFDLKNILIKYLPEPQNDKPAYRVLRELFTLEKELNEHTRIEDLILVPKVKSMEEVLKNRKN